MTGGVDPVTPTRRPGRGAGPARAGRAVAPGAAMRPTATPSGRVDLPETLRYRLKNRLLGPPIASDRQSSERLGKPTALAVLSSDVHLVVGLRHRADAHPAGHRRRGWRRTRWSSR